MSRPAFNAGHPAFGASPRRRGFTMLEMLITVTVMAVVAATVIPAMSDNRCVSLAAAAAILQSDLELVQSLRIAYPNVEHVLVLDPDGNRWWIADGGDPDTPIAIEPGAAPYITVLGERRARSAGAVSLMVPDPVDRIVEFNAYGGLETGRVSPSILFTAGELGLFLSISRTTGVIRTLSAADTGAAETDPGGLVTLGGSGTIDGSPSSSSSDSLAGTLTLGDDASIWNVLDASIWNVLGDAPDGSVDAPASGGGPPSLGGALPPGQSDATPGNGGRNKR